MRVMYDHNNCVPRCVDGERPELLSENITHSGHQQKKYGDVFGNMVGKAIKRVLGTWSYLLSTSVLMRYRWRKMS